MLQTRGGDCGCASLSIYQEVGRHQAERPGRLRGQGRAPGGLSGGRLRRDQAPHHRSGAGLFHLPRRLFRRQWERDRRRCHRDLCGGSDGLARFPDAGHPQSAGRGLRRVRDEAESRGHRADLLHLPRRHWLRTMGFGLAVDAARQCPRHRAHGVHRFPDDGGLGLPEHQRRRPRRLPDEARCVRLRASLLHVPRRHRRRHRVRRGPRYPRQCLCRGPDDLDRLPGEQDALSGDQRRRHGRLRGQAEPMASGAASLVYSTYLGGSGDDGANGIVVDASGNATVVGRTDSTDFPMAGHPISEHQRGRLRRLRGEARSCRLDAPLRDLPRRQR